MCVRRQYTCLPAGLGDAVTFPTVNNILKSTVAKVIDEWFDSILSLKSRSLFFYSLYLMQIKFDLFVFSCSN